jgi:hypothetical protein
MLLKFTLSILLSMCLGVFSAQTTFNTSRFYAAITNNDLKDINSVLQDLTSFKNKEAYQGALLMKKSGLLSDVGEKLKLFKEGRKTLETAISKDTSNSEYRFLRLLIQENAPKIVNYNAEIKKDASYLRENYKNLSHPLQKEILNYSIHSKELKLEDFKNETHD